MKINLSLLKPLTTIKHGFFMKKIILIMISFVSLTTNADVMNVYYEGVVTKITVHNPTIPFGQSSERPRGYQTGDIISGKMSIDTDIALSFPPFVHKPKYGTYTSHYNTPTHDTNNTKIIYRLPFISPDNHQGFITSSHNPEPSVTNNDNLELINGTNQIDPSTGKQTNNLDGMRINNSDNIYDKESKQRMPVIQHWTSLDFSAESFLNGISLNQNFELSSANLIGRSGAIRYANSFGGGPDAQFSRYPASNSGIVFDITSIKVETVSNSTVEQCE
jgi:hypothetical protein